MLTVTVPAVAAEHRSAALPGILFAALSAGELLGGLIYGGRAWRLPTAHRLVIGQTATVVAVGSFAVLTDTPVGMLAAIFAVGACTAPTSIASSALLDDIAPAGSLTRSYTAMVAVGLLGIATGTTSGGALATSLGTRPALLLASGVLGVVGTWTVLRIHTLTPAAAPTAGAAAAVPAADPGGTAANTATYRMVRTSSRPWGRR
jgi:hypothetical protein